jgi:hypothetical protein
MLATIETLEREKLAQEERNAQIIKENRDLLDQLEQLNLAVAESDGQVDALTTALQSSEQEIEKLSALAGRTQALERQLLDLEREYSQLQSSLEIKVIDERTAMQRWRRAEKTIVDLHDQIDIIEREAKEDRERHLDIVARMERRMAVDVELGTAAARLKAGAARGDGDQKPGTSVVSHFVKDILLDNANLQNGILELREMLVNSNDEVDRLREQLRIHRPLSPTEDDTATPTLQKELGAESIINQELHIHHHYHGSGPRKEPGPSRAQPRRPRAKRHVLAVGHFAPPDLPPASTARAILAQTSVTVPQNSNRWSNATTLAPSLPGSPLSPAHRPASVNERVFSDIADDSSRPTSASESIEPASPNFISSTVPKLEFEIAKAHPKVATRTVSNPLPFKPKSTPASAVISTVSPQDAMEMFLYSPSIHSAIPEENEDMSDATSLLSPTLEPATSRVPLRRVASHESLISVSGMDIHTLQSRPSQLLYSSSPSFASPSSGGSTQPVLTPWTATAIPNMSSRDVDSSTLHRSLLYGSNAGQRRGLRERRSGGFEGIGKKVGGWVLGKWGVSPSRNEAPRPDSGGSGSRERPGPSPSQPAPKRPSQTPRDSIPIRLRPSGVNQNGPIWGFFDAIPETPSQLEPTALDEEALKDSLGDV